MKKNSMFFISFLSISLLHMSSNIISVAMADIQLQFPQINTALLQSLVTIPSAAMVICVLISGFLASAIGKRRILLFSLVLYTISGTVPIFIDNFYVLLTSRLLFGIALGLIQPLPTGLVADFFEPEKQASVIGIQGAINGIGQMIMTFCAGLLAVSDWHNTFWAYSMGAIVFVFVFFNIPEPNKNQNAVRPSMENILTLSKEVWIIAALMAVFSICYISIYTYLPLLVAQSGLGNAAVLGTSMTLMTLSTFIVGVFFGKVFGYMKHWIGFVSISLVGIGMLLLSLANSMLLITIALILIGVGISLFAPYAVVQITSFSPEGLSTVSIGIMLALCNLGVFLSPYILTSIGELLGNSDVRFIFLVCASAMFIGSLGLLLSCCKRRRQPVH